MADIFEIYLCSIELSIADNVQQYRFVSIRPTAEVAVEIKKPPDVGGFISSDQIGFYGVTQH